MAFDPSSNPSPSSPLSPRERWERGRHFGHRHHHRGHGIIPGLVLVAWGGLLLLREQGVLSPTLRAFDLWPLVVIGLGLSIAAQRRRLGGVLFGFAVALLGAALLAQRLGYALGVARLWPILIIAGVYYRKLGLPLYESMIGLSVLSWSMSLSLYNSDLSFNVFFDIAFYLLAGILILGRKYVWLVLLMIPAALNRETSLLIPFMLFFAVRSNTAGEQDQRPGFIAAAVALGIFAIIFAGLRIYYGPQPFLTADGYYPGIGLLALNLGRWATWGQMAITLGVIPMLALFAYREWPRVLKVFFWVVVPVWFVAHFVGALVAESRLLLVPQALVFIPAALSGLAATHRQVGEESATVG